MSSYNRILRERRDAMQNNDDHDDRVLRYRTDQQILNSVTPNEDELDIFFNNHEEDTDSSSSFRNMSLSPSYNTRRRSPSSYTFMSSEESRDKRDELIEDKKDRRDKLKILKRKIAEKKKYHNATRKIQNTYKKYLSKKNKKNNEKGDECLILGGKRKKNKRKKTKRKKNKRRKTSRRYKR